VADRQDQSPLDLANHVAATVKRRARPWRAIIALVLAIAAATVSSTVGHTVTGGLFARGYVTASIIVVSTAAAFTLFAVASVVGLAAKSREVFEPRTGSAHAAVIRYTVMLVGGIATLLVTLTLLRVPVGKLIVGGALTTIIIGIAAQQSLGNVFAGIVLLLSRPFTVGDAVLLRSGALGGPLEGTVTEIGIIYVRLGTANGVLYLPNSQVLAAGVGHIEPDPQTAEPAGVPASESAPEQRAPDGASPPPPGAPPPGAPPPGAASSGAASPGAAPSGAPSSGAAPSGAAPG
jgi:Mechanosensitive ion channel